jgi:hypothetical protein
MRCFGGCPDVEAVLLDGRLDLVAPSALGLWVFFNQGFK